MCIRDRLSALYFHLNIDVQSVPSRAGITTLISMMRLRGLTYKLAPDRIARHQSPNDVVSRALIASAGIRATDEPSEKKHTKKDTTRTGKL